jgi:DNA-binding MarR family transcriptional regulator
VTRRSDTPSEFIEQIAVLLEADGMPRVAGRLFGLLLVSEDARSLDELAEQLGVSKPSISVNARLLEDKGVVERVSRQGDRRDYYRIADDILERTLEQRINRWRRFHETIAGACASCGGTDVVRIRLSHMADAYAHMLDATSRALNEWRVRPVKRASRAIHSPDRSR